MMKRHGSHGAGTWAPPGGKLDFGESFFECAKREVKEETGIDISSIDIVGVTNDIHKDESKHFVTVNVKAKSWSGEPNILEPEKCTEMGWSDIHKLPQPLFLPIRHIIESNSFCACGSGKSFKDCPNKPPL